MGMTLSHMWFKFEENSENHVRYGSLWSWTGLLDKELLRFYSLVEVNSLIAYLIQFPLIYVAQ